MKTLVIITHRYHYHICQVAILLAIKQFNPDKVAILFDDVVGTQVGWNELGKKLITDIKKIYFFQPGSIYAIPFSSLTNVQSEPRGWIRQQYIKLNLHKVLQGDEWIVVDGDVLINHSLDLQKYCYINPSDPLRLHHDLFVRYVLDLTNQQTNFNNKPVEFSSVPIRLLNRKTLEGLEQYLYELHSTDIQNITNSFTLKKNRENYFELSEYDLIGNYQNFISKDLLPLKELEIYFEPTEKLYSTWDFLKNKIAVLHGWDNLPIEWYDQFGVKINQEIWNLLYESKNNL